MGREADLRPDPAPAPQRVRDPDDDYIVALAEATGSVVVTGDDDLLEADLTTPAITPLALNRATRLPLIATLAAR